MANKLIIRSNFRLLPGAARDGVQDAVDKWAEAGEDGAKASLARKESQHGYALNTLYDSIDGRRTGELRAVIDTEPFYARFFEYGFYDVAPFGFMRSGKRKGDAAFKKEAGVSVERAIRRRASIR